MEIVIPHKYEFKIQIIMTKNSSDLCFLKIHGIKVEGYHACLRGKDQLFLSHLSLQQPPMQSLLGDLYYLLPTHTIIVSKHAPIMQELTMCVQKELTIVVIQWNHLKEEHLLQRSTYLK